jgi:hypothetical protein
MAKQSPMSIHIALTRLAADISASLGDELKKAEAIAEKHRNKDQMTTTAFADFDKKSNALMNVLTSLLKAMSEMRSIAGSKSGL